MNSLSYYVLRSHTLCDRYAAARSRAAPLCVFLCALVEGTRAMKTYGGVFVAVALILNVAR